MEDLNNILERNRKAVSAVVSIYIAPILEKGCANTCMKNELKEARTQPIENSFLPARRIAFKTQADTVPTPGIVFESPSLIVDPVACKTSCPP